MIYGSLGAAIALLVWMYMISLVVLVGAEFNAMLFPRAMLGKELTAISGTESRDLAPGVVDPNCACHPSAARTCLLLSSGFEIPYRKQTTRITSIRSRDN